METRAGSQRTSCKRFAPHYLAHCCFIQNHAKRIAANSHPFFSAKKPPFPSRCTIGQKITSGCFSPLTLHQPDFRNILPDARGKYDPFALGTASNQVSSGSKCGYYIFDFYTYHSTVCKHSTGQVDDCINIFKHILPSPFKVVSAEI